MQRPDTPSCLRIKRIVQSTLADWSLCSTLKVTINKMYSCLGILSLLLLCLHPSLAYFNGADEESCYNHYIRHTTTVSGITVVSPSMVCDPCGYTLWIVRELSDTGGPPREIMTNGEFNYTLNTTYEIELRPGNNGFLGFLIQARVQDRSSDTFNSNSEIAGTWADEGMDSLYRPLRCNISSAGGSETFPNSATQRDANDLRGESRSVFLRWTAPTEDPGEDIVFWFTIVQLHITHFLPVKGPVGILDRPPSPSTTQEPTTEPATNEVTSDPLSTTYTNSTDSSGCSTTPVSYPLVLGVFIIAGLFRLV